MFDERNSQVCLVSDLGDRDTSRDLNKLLETTEQNKILRLKSRGSSPRGAQHLTMMRFEIPSKKYFWGRMRHDWGLWAFSCVVEKLLSLSWIKVGWQEDEAKKFWSLVYQSWGNQRWTINKINIHISYSKRNYSAFRWYWHHRDQVFYLLFMAISYRRQCTFSSFFLLFFYRKWELLRHVFVVEI